MFLESSGFLSNLIKQTNREKKSKAMANDRAVWQHAGQDIWPPRVPGPTNTGAALHTRLAAK